MPTTSKIRPILHLPSWELVGTNTFTPTAPSTADPLFGFDSPYFDKDLFFHWPDFRSNTLHRFSAKQNAWDNNLASTVGLSGIGSPGTGTMVLEYAAPAGTILLSATAGTTNSITTSLQIKENIVGRTVRIIEGPNAGQDFIIKHYTTGTNSVLTFTTAGTAFNATTKFHLLTGSIWYCHGGSGVGVMDIATRNHVARSSTNVGTSPSTGSTSALIPLHRADDNYFSGNVVVSTATSATLPSGVANYNFTNYEIFIVSGTGAGQIRKISAHAANTITISPAWTVNPDTTSVFKIRGDSDAILFFTTNTTNSYKFSISANTWTSFVPTPARGLTYSNPAHGDWSLIREGWTVPDVGANKMGGQNGRFIFSVRPSGSSRTTGTTVGGIDVFDICTNGWTNHNDVYYGGQPTANSCFYNDGRYVYHMEALTGRYWRFDPTTGLNKLLTTCPYPHGTGTTVYGTRMWIVKYNDGGDTFTYLYTRLFGGKNEYLRLLIQE